MFVIKDEYMKIYKNNCEQLYQILYKLNNMKHNFNYGISLYNQLCNRINVEILKNYLNDRFNLDNDKIFYLNNVFVELKHSRIIIKSKYNYPRILKSLNCYDRNIFVCDFINKDYFFLSNFSKEILKIY